ncbi:MAG: phosphatidyl-myo-inositol alpha-mannosyltransferase [Frankiales bacterium]|nr:phosphatidyl-myo-inositol alpha-mannosyltransferase [Frankiales bacterium]
MRVGLVCPYSWDVPGGVQAHVHDLAEALIALGHSVSVLAPVDEPDSADLPSYVVPAGRTVPVPYNGSVARLCFGPLSLARTRRWLRKGHFDVLHLHEPTVPSLSMLACFAAKGAMVATFHTATARSRALQVFGTTLQPGLEKITGRIAVSPAARRVVVEHLGHDAVLIPNGVDVARFAVDRPPHDRPTVVFLGRVDEPRKGLQVLLDALPALRAQVPDVELVVAGPGEVEAPPGVRVLGLVDEKDKPSVYAGGDVYCAPNTHGESFGIVLIEAMAAGTPVVASDLEAFRRVLDDGEAGVLFPVGDAEALAGTLAALLNDPERRRLLAARGSRVVQAYDWRHVAREIVEVYETVRAAAPVELEDPYEPDLDEVDTAVDDPSRVPETLRRWLAVVRDAVELR